MFEAKSYICIHTKGNTMSEKIKQLEALYSETPDDPFVIYALAKECEQAGFLDRSKSLYVKLLREHVNYVGTYYHYGKLLEKMDHPSDAKKVYLSGLEIAKKLGDDLAYRELFAAKTELESE